MTDKPPAEPTTPTDSTPTPTKTAADFGIRRSLSKRHNISRQEDLDAEIQQEHDPTSVFSPKRDVEKVSEVLEIDKPTPDRWIPRHPDLVRITGVHPLNAEVPLKRFNTDAAPITPNSLHYVRNHGAVPKLDWKTHKLHVEGLVNKPQVFSMDDLAKLPFINIPVTFACDGNRRKEVNRQRHSKGFNWGSGVISTAFWKGVRLCDVLQLCEVKTLLEGAKFVCFGGCDKLPEGIYGTSIPLATAMDRNNDILLAYEMNNEPLPPDHGYPLRLLIPGFVGGRNIKWLSFINVSNKESESWYHLHDNKVFPSFVGFGRADREDWWAKPQFTLYELNINSIITSPVHGEEVHLHSTLAETLELRGVAYSGGGREIIRVEVSIDEGNKWLECSREFPKYSLQHGIKRWTWCVWRLSLPIWKILKSEEIVVRAWDTSNNTQPKDLTWNLLGMMNNSWYRVKVRLLDEIRVVFEHPTVPSDKEGGWIEKKLYPPKKISIKHKPPYRLISEDEVAKHNKEEDPWIIVDGVVYDLSEFLGMHPGGIASIVLNSGKDITSLFNSIHGEDAKKWMTHFSIGIISEKGESKGLIPGISRPAHCALQPRKWIEVKLKSREPISHDSYKFQFELVDKRKKLGLPVGQHLLLEAQLGGEDVVVRPYTPTAPLNDKEDVGIIEMVIKVYRAGSNPHFNAGGVLTQYLEKAAIGTKLRVKGPEGSLKYIRHGVMAVHGHPIRVKKISMIAGGSGITPMFQIIKSVLTTDDNPPEMSLLYSNHSKEDILLRAELETLSKAYPDVFKLWHTISSAPKGEEWNYSIGRITLPMMQEHLFPPSEKPSECVVLLCGPPTMINRGVLPLLEKWGYHDDAIFEF